MTNEEAKRQLESAYPYLSNEIKLALDKVIDALGDCYIIPKNSTWIIDGIDVQEAIEKQKPKKPINISQEHAWAEFTGRCPNCHNLVREVWNFCPRCSQAIDWSEDND